MATDKYQNGDSSVGKNGSVEMDESEYSDATQFFEKGRIKQLQDERVKIQKKTFTKWCNTFLNLARLEITDLFTDLCDGILLIKLLEIISGDKLGKPNRGRMRVHKIENLNKVLEYLKKKKIVLENIGAEDIQDGNPRLILGLIWTIILRFIIDPIEIPADEDESTEKKFAKDALLIWCQRKTAGYPNVKIDNFTSSWRSGMGFNALIHAHRPDLIDYQSLNPTDHIASLNNAFDVAEKRLGIARLLDAEDIDVNRPDEKSIITYVSMYYHYFAKQKSELTSAKRIARIIATLMEDEASRQKYMMLVTDLLQWIKLKIAELSDRRFPNSLRAIQDEMTRFKNYRTMDKPPKYKEKGDLEALFFDIQTKEKALRRKLFVPNQGLLLHDVETAWGLLESAEYARQVALNEELIRQERLEQLARKFERKAKLRETWLREMAVVLQDNDFGKTSGQVEASVKKHEAISADILPREDRFKNLTAMANELSKENYHDKERTKAREREIIDKWNQLLDALDRRHLSLMSLNDLMKILRDIDTLSSELSAIEPAVKSRDLGKHLLGVESLLQTHKLLDAQVMAQGDWLKTIQSRTQAYVRQKGAEYEMLQKRCQDVQAQYDNLIHLSQSRRVALEHARELYQFIQDDEEEESWLNEKLRVCQNLMQQSELTAVPQYQRSLKTLETEMQGHWQKSKQVMAHGERLLTSQQHVVSSTNRDEVQKRLKSLQLHWDDLRRIMGILSKWLKEAQQAGQYFQEANEAESWIREKTPLACSDDFGKDETTAESLLSRHIRLEEEIAAYNSDIQRLDDLAQELSKAEYVAAVSSSNPTDHGKAHKVVEERLVPQVRALYKYNGNGLTVEKGEILNLIQKTNPDWWRVSKDDGVEGFVPANYVKEVEAKVAEILVEMPQKAATNGEHVMPADQPDSAAENAITNRQKHISSSYKRLIKLGQSRRRFLEDAIKLYKFYRECDEFENWARQTEKKLHDPPDSKQIDVVRRKFDDLVSDTAVNGGTRLNNINKMADELVSAGHSQKDHIRNRQHDMNNLWKSLLKLRDAKAKTLESVEGLMQFNQMCDETRSWITEKRDMFNQFDEANDLKSLQALQRRHQAMERELKPVEDKIKTLKELGEQVRRAYPEQSDRVNISLKELDEMWDELIEQTTVRRKRLEETQGQQMFHNAVDDLMTWAEKTKDKLLDMEKPVDVAQAEELLEQHAELGNDIKRHDDEFAYVDDLGRRLLKKSPHDSAAVTKTLKILAAKHEELAQLWQVKETHLEDMLELQLFSREADHIDASTKNHEAILDLADVGDSVESVENLLKQHGNAENKLYAQDERLKAFNELADRLISENHPHSKFIDQRRNEVLKHRDVAKIKAKQRRLNLEASLAFHEFKRDSEELSAWIDDKMKIAADESYKDGTNLERKLKKHEAFEAELKSNADRLHRLNAEGRELENEKHFKSNEIRKILSNLNEEWSNLDSLAKNRGDKLRQACDQRNLNRMLDDANLKLQEMEKNLASNDYGADLHSVKQLLQKHTMLEQDMANYDKRMGQIVGKGEQLAKDHFDSKRILSSIHDFHKHFRSLQEPAALRRKMLEESLKLHQLKFDIDVEMQWIREKMPIASSANFGESLTDTTNLHKKHEQLETEITGHQTVIDRVLGDADRLLKTKSSSIADPQRHDDIRKSADRLKSHWSVLKTLMAERRVNLNRALKCQRYLSEAAELDSWMTEKRNLLSSTSVGNDEDAANKLLAKHKSFEEEASSYKRILQSLGQDAASLVAEKLPESEKVSARQQELEQNLDNVMKLSETRHMHLEQAVCLFQYLRESRDLEDWINEQLQTAMSDDYGRDYEHLSDLVAKFEDFKQRVKTGSERFIMCENSAKQLLERQPPFARDVQQRQEQLRAAWALLLDYIEGRERKLEAAEEIHRFNRDVADALSRIQEKYATIPTDDLGKDINSVQSLLKKHEAFENELVALEAQLQVLLDDSARLQSAYPGGNAEHISAHQQMLVDQWNRLQEKALQRRDDLNAAYDLQRFLANARDLIGFANQSVQSMQIVQTERHVRDLQAAELAHHEHQLLKAEIAARDPDFVQLQDMSTKMIKVNHYAKDEIADKMKQVLAARESMLREFDSKNLWLQQIVEWHAFSREAKQILSAINAHETTMKSGSTYGNVTEVNSLIRKHETFEKLLAPLEERVGSLRQTGSGLVARKHMQSPDIQNVCDDVEKRYKNLKRAVTERRRTLQQAMALAKFNADVSEAEWWIDEKHKKLPARDANQLQSLEEKLKMLQKHQAFEAELVSNEVRIKQIESESASIVQQLPPDESKKMERAKVNLLGKWRELVRASQDQSVALEEARDILNFQQMVERVMTWIREKELMITAGDMGRDYEHCISLQKKLSDVESDSVVDDDTLKSIGLLADKLIKQGRTDKKDVQVQLDDLNKKYKATRAALTEYRRKLENALEVHSFNRDVDETLARIAEKGQLLNVDDSGKDLTTVESLLRKQDALERDMTAIQDRIQKHQKDGEALLAKSPPLKETIEHSLARLNEDWGHLRVLARDRRSMLDDNFKFQKLLESVKDAENWSVSMHKQLSAYFKPNNVAEAAVHLESHKEKKAAVASRNESIEQLKKNGEKLMHEQPARKKEIQEALNKLSRLNDDVLRTWDIENAKLLRWYDMLTFDEQADLAESWLSSKEAFLLNDDLGDSMDAVDNLLKKHDGFETALRAQSEKVENLKRKQDDLVKKHPESKDHVTKSYNEVEKRYARLMDSLHRRKSMLADSREWHAFLKTCHELMSMINAKLQIAYDECYLEPTNLQSKLQKNLTFDAELKTNESRLETVNKDGRRLIDSGHFAKEQIELQLKEINNGWNELTKASAEKTLRLKEAFDAYQFNRQLEALDRWLDAVEHKLALDDHGKDLASVTGLLKRHEQLEHGIVTRETDVQALKSRLGLFSKEKNFLLEDLSTKTNSIIERYAGLKEPCEIRKQNLKDAQALYQWLRDADEESAYIKEKEAAVFSSFYGDSLQSTQNLIKKHQLLESDVIEHEPQFQVVRKTASEMIRRKHYAEDAIRTRNGALEKEIQNLKDQIVVHRLKLNDAMDAQKFYADIIEAQAWIHDRAPIVSSSETGVDEASVESLQRKLDNAERDIYKYGSHIDGLKAVATEMINKRHFDSAEIDTKQKHVESEYSRILRLCQQRKVRLAEAMKYFSYVRQVDDLMSWLKEKENAANSEDYGRDLEQCQQLMTEFEQLVRELSGAGERVAVVQRYQEDLLRANHPNQVSIKAKGADLLQLWQEVNEATTERQQALMGARQVHKFDQDADETLAWLQEKEAILLSESSDDDLGQMDLATIHSKLQRHDVFTRELTAVEKQVETLKKEVERLVGQYPDTREHLEFRDQELEDVLKDVLSTSHQRYDKLKHAEHLQAYFDDYRALVSWMNEMNVAMCSETMSRDVAGAESLMRRHQEYRSEMDARAPMVDQFVKKGRSMISSKHLLSAEIEEKVDNLESLHNNLNRTWGERQKLYELNLDVQRWKKDASSLDTWLLEREINLNDDWKRAETVAHVDDMIRKHDDFLSSLSAQEPKFEAIKRLTLLELAFTNQQEREEERRKIDEQRREKQRKDQIKTLEKQKFLHERKIERERRRTGEIQFFKPNDNGSSGSQSPQLLRRSSQTGLVVAPSNGEAIEIVNGDTTVSDRDRSMSAPSPVSVKKPPVPPKPAVGSPSITAAAPFPVVARHRNGSAGSSDSGEPQQVFATPTGRRPSVDLKKTQSFNVDPSQSVGKKMVKRTPTFTTRRQHSLKKVRKWDEMQSIEKEGFLERKQDLQSGGKKATIRSWKNFYTVLCGQLICFFKDEECFMENNAASPPVNILNAVCAPAPEYQKRKNAFKLRIQDGSEYLFSAPTEQEMRDWIQKVAFHAALPPSLQLKPFSNREENTTPPEHRLRYDEMEDVLPKPPPVPSRQYTNTESIQVAPGNQSRQTYSDSPPPTPPSVGPPPVVMRKGQNGFDGVLHYDKDTNIVDQAATPSAYYNADARSKSATLPTGSLPPSIGPKPQTAPRNSNSLRRSQGNPDLDISQEIQGSTGDLSDGSSITDPEEKKKKRGSRIGSFFKSKKRESKESSAD